MIRYRYNQQVSPPAPFVLIRIGRPDNSSHLDELPAQLDWGSDVTVIPGAVVAQLGLQQVDEQLTLGFGGQVFASAAYYVRLTLHDLPPLLIRVIANDQEPFVLLGRDLLNRYRIILDGPAGVFSIESEAPA